MNTIKHFLVVFVLAIFTLYGCNDDLNNSIEGVENPFKSVLVAGSTTSSSIATITLYAGQTTNVGNLVLSETDINSDGINDALLATYSLTGGWLMKEIHLWIGSSLVNMPQTKSGNPQIGQFPYSPTDVAGKNTYSITVPFTAINYSSCEAQYFVAAHASVYLGTRSETAWGAGTKLNLKGSWATYATINLVDNNKPVVTGNLPSLRVAGNSLSYAPLAFADVAELEAAGLSVSDTRCADDQMEISVSETSSGTCPITLVRTYSIADACGNVSSVSQTIVIEDIVAPVLIGQGASAVITEPAQPVFTTPTVSDNFDANPTVVIADVTVTSTGSKTITRTWTASDACGNSSSVSQSITINNAIVVGPVCTSWQTETAYGGNAAGSGNAWWFSYNGVDVQTIWAGQHYNAGTVQLVNGVLVVTLSNGWELQDVAEPVKVQGYNTLPNSRPASGQFTTYKGKQTSVAVGSFSNYVVHLDVRKCNSSN
jgi:hypothetical protein